uniref:SCY domain-containing protein n=1 Tax=Ascaris lumbricoides TaxID=6252 RepID=A0A0M3HQ57_ASCLU
LLKVGFTFSVAKTQVKCKGSVLQRVQCEVVEESFDCRKELPQTFWRSLQQSKRHEKKEVCDGSRIDCHEIRIEGPRI